MYGAERATLDLASGLKAAGHTPSFILLEESRLKLARSGLREAIASAGLAAHLVDIESRLSFRAINGIHEHLVDLQADILHTVGYKADVHGGIATRWGREWPLISTVHGWLFRPDVKERFYGWINLHALRRCSRVVALSRFYEDMLLSKGVAREKLERIPSGVDVQRMPLIPPPSGPFTVGIMGRLSSEKNHAMFLRAARAVLDAGARASFIIAGDGPERAAIEAQIAALNLSPHVTLAGFMSREDFLSLAHVSALCSQIENLPYTALEAMAAGRPVVATNVGGLPDLVDEGVSGYLVPLDDASAMADRFMRLAADSALREKMGAMGRYKLESEFELSVMVARHLELYQAALNI